MFTANQRVREAPLGVNTPTGQGVGGSFALDFRFDEIDGKQTVQIIWVKGGGGGLLGKKEEAELHGSAEEKR